MHSNTLEKEVKQPGLRKVKSHAAWIQSSKVEDEVHSARDFTKICGFAKVCHCWLKPEG